ncbi:MAG: lipoprotein NlpD [Betaproteobacteria bacterium]|nr:lipoprotein NlpD [Betaproteobacteria bacterium]
MKPVKVVALVVVLVVAAGCASRRTPAPVVDARAPKPVAAKSFSPAPIPPPSGELYTVKRGDTLYSIALEHGADHRELAQWNQLDHPTRLRAGQQLRVTPSAVALAPAPAPELERQAQVGSARILGRVESRPLESLPPLPPRAPARTVPPRIEPAKAELAKSEPTPASAALAQFIWPVKGKVLAEFAEPRKKGIDIDGRVGDAIVASAPGRVTYIGTGIPGMGKLVVLKHDNGFITVYAHNRNILVKEQQAVARGQKIAELGSTDSERPKLHFQIRKGASAVDPLLYLPKF